MLAKSLGSDGNQPTHLILMLVMVSSREELYCIHGLLVQLEKSDVGCFMEGVYSRAFGYADDLKLLTSTVQANAYSD